MPAPSESLFPAETLFPGEYLSAVYGFGGLNILLEFAEADLSEVSPEWVDVTADCQGMEWWSGINREGDDPQPGGATIRMRNENRRWEPDYVAGQFYPNITAHRRFRLTLTDTEGDPLQQGLWYVTDIAIDYPAGTGYSEVTFTCADGFEVLALDDLPQLDPPDAESYSDVVGFDEPAIYYTLGDPAGTRAKPNIIHGRKTVGRGKDKHRRKFKRRRGTRYSTRSEAGAVAGPAGTYKGNPTLGEPSLVVGDSEPSVRFDGVNDWVKVVLEDADDLQSGNKITLEALVKPSTVSGVDAIIGGPDLSGGSCFDLKRESATFAFGVAATGPVTVRAAGGTVVADTVYHVVGTWDGTNAILYVDGAEVARSTGSIVMAGSGSLMGVGVIAPGSPTQFWEGWIGHAAVYEFALPPERVLAHYEAARVRGYPQQTAGERIAEIATHALWAETGIQTSGRDVQPVMQHGQARPDEVAELAHAEGARTMFFFDGDGNPVYLGHEWQASSANYTTTQATLGDQAGETRYQDFEPVYDNETYNEVTASHEAGEAVTVGTGLPAPRRAHTEFTDVLLVEHSEVESLAAATLAFYEDPQLRPVSVTLNGADSGRLHHILHREIGDQIRVKKSGTSGARIDRVTNIIGYRKTLTVDRHLTCTWNLARGFNAAGGVWKAGVVGFSEAGSTTVAA